MCRLRLVPLGKRLLNSRLEVSWNAIQACYNDMNMIGNLQTAWSLHIALAVLLLTGLFSLPSMSMQVGSMDRSSGTATYYESSTAGHRHDVPTPCCNDMLGSLIMSCGLLIPSMACATLFAGTRRVAFSSLFVHITYRKTATPPPKI